MTPPSKLENLDCAELNSRPRGPPEIPIVTLKIGSHDEAIIRPSAPQADPQTEGRDASPPFSKIILRGFTTTREGSALEYLQRVWQ